MQATLRKTAGLGLMFMAIVIARGAIAGGGRIVPGATNNAEDCDDRRFPGIQPCPTFGERPGDAILTVSIRAPLPDPANQLALFCCPPPGCSPAASVRRNGRLRAPPRPSASSPACAALAGADASGRVVGAARLRGTRAGMRGSVACAPGRAAERRLIFLVDRVAAIGY